MKAPGKFVWTLVTPEMAAEFLAAMPRNRQPRVSRIRKMAESMRRGNWTSNHQAAAVDEKNTFVDGQHRMKAVILSGVATWMWIYHADVALATMHIDEGAARTDADALFIGGEDKATANSVSILRRMLLGFEKNSKAFTPSRDDIRDALNKHRNAIEFVLEHLPNRSKGMTHASLRGTVARAWYTADRGRLAQFCEVIKTGMPTGPNDQAAIRLRDHMRNSSETSGGEEKRAITARKVESALKAFLDGRGLTKLYECSEELFPIP